MKILLRLSMAAIAIGLASSALATTQQDICRAAGLSLGKGLVLCQAYVYLELCESSSPIFPKLQPKLCNDTLALYNHKTTVPMPGLFSPTTITATANLGLSAGGIARNITVTNTGSSIANNVTFAAVSNPSILSVVPASCPSIPAGGTCQIIVTPTAVPSAAPGVANPSAITISFNGSNTNIATTAVNVVTFGSAYQDGYIFAIDDTTANTGSVGGFAAALSDQFVPTAGIQWVPAAFVTQVTGATSLSSGAANTDQIVMFMNVNSPLTLPNAYAAGFCENYTSTNSYTGWYLPAICEMGYDSSGVLSGCAMTSASAMPNMQTNLVDSGFVTNFAPGAYWSSTDRGGSAAWIQTFVPSSQDSLIKSTPHGVRCARALTP